jgi:hypothetical protein
MLRGSQTCSRCASVDYPPLRIDQAEMRILPGTARLERIFRGQIRIPVDHCQRSRLVGRAQLLGHSFDKCLGDIRGRSRLRVSDGRFARAPSNADRARHATGGGTKRECGPQVLRHIIDAGAFARRARAAIDAGVSTATIPAFANPSTRIALPKESPCTCRGNCKARHVGIGKTGNQAADQSRTGAPLACDDQIALPRTIARQNLFSNSSRFAGTPAGSFPIFARRSISCHNAS